MFRIDKIFKIKDNKLFVKWKGYNNSINSGLIKQTLYK